MPELDASQPSDQAGEVYDPQSPWAGMWTDPKGGGRIVVIQPLDAGGDVVMFTYEEDDELSKSWLQMCESTRLKPDHGDYIVKYIQDGWYVMPYDGPQLPMTAVPFQSSEKAVEWTAGWMRENQRKGRIWSQTLSTFHHEETM